MPACTQLFIAEYQNGAFLGGRASGSFDITVSANAAALGGVFEKFRITKSQNGVFLFRPNEHIERFYAQCREAQFPLVDRAEIYAAARLFAQNGLCGVMVVSVVCTDADEKRFLFFARMVDAVLCQMPVSMSFGSGKQWGVINVDGGVVDGGCGVFFCVNGRIVAPKVFSCDSVMRRCVIEITRTKGFIVDERVVFFDEIVGAIRNGRCTEVFVADAEHGIVAVGTLFDKQNELVVTGSRVGAFSAKMRGEIDAFLAGETRFGFTYAEKIL